MSEKISYNIIERTTKKDPLYLQNILYDRVFDINNIKSLSISITIPKNLSVYIVDDIKFYNTKINRIEFFLEESSSLVYRLFVANHKLCKTCKKNYISTCQSIPENFEKYITINLQGQNSKAHVKCHYLGDKNSEFKIYTNQNHTESNTISSLIVKSVLDNNAKLTCNNKVHVKKNLTKVISEQLNKNLVLSENVKIKTLPILEINSKNAKSHHGATIFNLSKKDLFYLKSRGLSKTESEKILIDAFLNK